METKMKQFRLIVMDYCTGDVWTKEVNAKELAEFIINNAYNHDISIIDIREMILYL